MNAPAVFAPTPLDLAPATIAAARADALARGVGVAQLLEERAGLPAAVFHASLAAATCYPAVSMDELHRWEPAFDRLPFDEAVRRQAVLFTDDAGDLAMAFADPFDHALLAWGDARVDAPFRWVLAHHADLAAWLARAEDGRSAVASVIGTGSEEAGGTHVEDLSFRSIAADQSPIVRLVNSTLLDAHKAGASDIHLETQAAGLAIKYRIDGVLTSVGTPSGAQLAEQVVSRIKIMAELDIAERRVPQDGRFKAGIRGREIDFRVSIMPSVHGEDAVLRILDKQALSDEIRGLSLDHLGFDDVSVGTIRTLASEPYGMFLVTGPTGSGKTTTLYGAISETNTGRDKIITIEDPVEYQLPGVLQIPVNEKKGLTFARGLRSILRHDPDKVMVGEIRDPETAQIAIQAALTGHLVFTTVHANNVFDVLGRFTHMQVDPYSFVAALNGILAQRLVRINCRHCTTDETPDPEVLRASRIDPAEAAGWRFRAGRGCGHCRGTGYRGRRAIAEILVLDDELRESIVERAPIRRLKELAQAKGTRFLRQAALDLVASGETALAEANRVTFAG